MGGLVIGAFYYQTNLLSRRFDARLEITEQKIKAVEKRLEQQFDQVEKNLTALADDLKQEVRRRK